MKCIPFKQLWPHEKGPARSDFLGSTRVTACKRMYWWTCSESVLCTHHNDTIGSVPEYHRAPIVLMTVARLEGVSLVIEAASTASPWRDTARATIPPHGMHAPCP